MVKINRVKDTENGTFPDQEAAILKAVSFNNLRAFQGEVVIPIAPVNLIFGNNNAGKSSIFHSFLWIAEVLEKGNLNVHRPEPSGNYVDLGGLKNFVHKLPNGNVSESFGFKLDVAINPKTKTKIVDEVCSKVLININETAKAFIFPGRLSKKIDESKIKKLIQNIRQIPKDELKKSIATLVDSFYDQGCIISCGIEFTASSLQSSKGIFDSIRQNPKIEIKLNDKTVFQIHYKNDDNYKVKAFAPYINKLNKFSLVELNHVARKTYQKFKEFTSDPKKRDKTSHEISKTDLASLCLFLEKSIVMNSLINEMTFRQNTGLKIFPRIKKDRIRFGGYLAGKLLERKMQGKPFHYAHKKFAQDIRHDAVSLIWLELFEKLTLATRQFFLRINYLAGYRIYLEREISQQTLRDIHANDPYGTLEIKNLLDSEDKRKKINSLLFKYEAPFSVTVKGKSVKRLVLANKKIKGEWSFKDFGFGWSQVFPFILKLLDRKYSALFVEQPELHLSSYYQQKLMDLLIEVEFPQNTNSEIQRCPLFLECHSDIMIYRLLKRIREVSRKNKRFNLKDHFSILFVKEDPSGSKVGSIKIHSDGFLENKWQNGTIELAAADLLK